MRTGGFALRSASLNQRPAGFEMPTASLDFHTAAHNPRTGSLNERTARHASTSARSFVPPLSLRGDDREPRLDVRESRHAYRKYRRENRRPCPAGRKARDEDLDP